MREIKPYGTRSLGQAGTPDARRHTVRFSDAQGTRNLYVIGREAKQSSEINSRPWIASGLKPLAMTKLLRRAAAERRQLDLHAWPHSRAECHAFHKRSFSARRLGFHHRVGKSLD